PHSFPTRRSSDLSTSGVERPARISATDSYRIQVRAPPSHPKLRALYIAARVLAPCRIARSRIVAKSGIRPMYQKTSDTVKYVEIANTSHNSGELKFTQREPNAFGSGNAQ